MTSKRTMMWFSLLYLSMYFYMASYGNFISIYLRENMKLTYAQVGVIGSLGSLSAMVLVPIWGILADKLRKYRFIAGLTLAISILALFLYMNAPSFIFAIFAGMFYDGMISSASPIVDSITINYTENNNGNYGFYRGLGSLGYIIGTQVVGMILSYTKQNGHLFVIAMAFILLSIALLTKVPEPKRSSSIKLDLKKDLPLLFKNTKYINVLIIMMLSIGVSNAAGAYVTLHFIETLKGSKGHIGLLMFVMIIPEIVIIAKASHLVQKYGFKKMMLVAFFGFLMKWGLFSIFTNPYMFIGSSMFHSLGMGIFIPMNLIYINQVVDNKLSGSAIAIYSSMMYLSTAVFRIILGQVSDLMGTNSIMMITFVVVALGLVYGLMTLKEIDYQKVK